MCVSFCNCQGRNKRFSSYIFDFCFFTCHFMRVCWFFIFDWQTLAGLEGLVRASSFVVFIFNLSKARRPGGYQPFQGEVEAWTVAPARLTGFILNKACRIEVVISKVASIATVLCLITVAME